MLILALAEALPLGAVRRVAPTPLATPGNSVGTVRSVTD